MVNGETVTRMDKNGWQCSLPFYLYLFIFTFSLYLFIFLGIGASLNETKVQLAGNFAGDIELAELATAWIPPVSRNWT
jgi:hypothetical protein